MFNLLNKTILVTGGSSGIGKEIAIQCSNFGANVIIVGRDKERLTQTLNQLNQSSQMFICDLTQGENIINLVNLLPQLDGVVFCAGVVEYVPVKLLTQKKIDNIFNVNFNSQVLLTQYLLKNKKINLNSSLVYISSISSKIGVAGTAMYSSSKAALNTFAKVTASELASQKIRVNSICPGIILTPMGEHAKSVNNNIEKDYPLGLGSPIDIAGPCVFLLSDASKWITGTEIIVDGGLTLK